MQHRLFDLECTTDHHHYMPTISIEQGFSEIIPFTIMAADGVTPDLTYIVPPADLVSGNPDSVRVTLVPAASGPSRSFRADALGGSGSNIDLTTRVGGVVHHTVQLIAVTVPVDRSGAVIGEPGEPFRTPAAP